MRRILFAALAMIVASVVATRLPIVSAASPWKFAVGGGSLVDAGGNAKHFAFSAHAGPNGPSGHVVLTQVSTTFGDFQLQGHVTCLTVSGNRAAIGVGIEKGSGTATGQTGILLFVEDNGNGNSGAPDQFDNSGYVGDPSVCPVADPTVDVDSGNISVK